MSTFVGSVVTRWEVITGLVSMRGDRYVVAVDDDVLVTVPTADVVCVEVAA